MNTPDVKEVLRGLVYSHNRANANTTELHQTAVTLQAMLELLIERGVLSRHQRRACSSKRQPRWLISEG